MSHQSQTAPSEQHIRGLIGDDARPNGRLRLLCTPVAARIRQEWSGSYGSLWADIPKVYAEELPEEGVV
jgi:hypothetical protein